MTNMTTLSNLNTEQLTQFIQPDVTRILEQFLFEPNDNFTRTQIECQLDRYLSSLINEKAIQDYSIVCDESNNPPSAVEGNRLKVDMYIKHSATAEFIYIPALIAPYYKKDIDSHYNKFDRAMQGV